MLSGSGDYHGAKCCTIYSISLAFISLHHDLQSYKDSSIAKTQAYSESQMEEKPAFERIHKCFLSACHFIHTQWLLTLSVQSSSCSQACSPESRDNHVAEYWNS